MPREQITTLPGIGLLIPGAIWLGPHIRSPQTRRKRFSDIQGQNQATDEAMLGEPGPEMGEFAEPGESNIAEVNSHLM